ncbi:MAG TPA: tryptophan synthase subunit alpha, partial [Candidatus Thermoplasmatota archaeon]
METHCGHTVRPRRQGRPHRSRLLRGETLNGIARIAERFDRLRLRKEAALVPYFVAGYPSLSATREHLWEAFEGGASLVELGIPFSDPVADGPTIQRASHAALVKGMTQRKSLELIAGMRKEGFDLPVIGMTYANLLYKDGFAKTAKAWSAAGMDGAIVPDISLEDAGDFKHAWKQSRLATTFFVAPSTNDARVKKALASSTGFLYLVAVYGTTGARRDVAPDTLS